MPDTPETVPLPDLPPRGQVLELLFDDAALECIEQRAAPLMSGVFAEAPGSLLLIVRGQGVRLTLRTGDDACRLALAAFALASSLEGAGAAAAAALNRALAAKPEGVNHE